MKKIVFQLHNPSGTINQLMSLEVASAIQKISNKDIEIYNIHSGRYHNLNEKIHTARNINRKTKIKFVIDKNNPAIYELVDLPNIDRMSFRDDNCIDMYKDFEQINLSDNYYISDKEGMDEDELEFACGRNKLIIKDNVNYNFYNTLSYYSSLIYNKSEALKNFMSKINFKKEYVDLSKRISSDIGNYSSIHFRLSDHKYYSISDIEMFNSINSISKNDKIIIFTCDESHPTLKNLPRHCVLFSNIMKDYIKDLEDLPMYGDIVYDVINLLVMSMSNEFIGTQGSTYSGYATRYVNDYRYIGTENHKSKYKYPWYDFPFPKNQRYSPWWREWPEHASVAQW